MERNIRALQLRPSHGRGTAVTKVRLREGLACEIEEGKWRLAADMSAKSGGAETAPNPGVLERASLGSCLAIGYAMWAARRGITLRALEVEVQAGYDSRSEYGLEGGKPGYLQIRIQRYGWDRAAADYEKCWSGQIEPAQKRMLEMAALQPGERVLDVACGTGLISFPAALSVGPSGHVVGTDISDGMVAQACAEAGRRGIGHIEFHRGGAEELQFPESSFDAALCSLGLMYVPSPVTALR